jgi:hypothetical protein
MVGKLIISHYLEFQLTIYNSQRYFINEGIDKDCFIRCMFSVRQRRHFLEIPFYIFDE